MLQEWYGLTPAALNELNQQYAAPPPLLHLRLMDLVLALSMAYRMPMTDIRGMLRWHWHSRRRAAWWPTPIHAILAGDLSRVESTFHPHPASTLWTPSPAVQ
ncbi:hypothetical protein GCM10017781_38690 [Deinococcus metalli]|nr:hypothetical protein GCM10017781_38690 [Deinococcus metalli]